MYELTNRVPAFCDKEYRMHTVIEKKILQIAQERDEEILAANINYENGIKKIREQLNKILNAKYINLSDSTEAIAYLVGLIEGKNYIAKTTNIKLGYQASNGIEEITILYLVDTQKDELAAEELSNRFANRTVGTQPERAGKCAECLRDLHTTSDNYIQLACYKGNNIKNIFYSNTNVININKTDETNLESGICDSRYAYIIDYMDTVVSQRLDDENIGIDLETMKKLADEFAKQYKSDNKQSGSRVLRRN